MWGEVKFWAARYWKWILLAIGMLLMTAIFVIVSRFSASDDSQMKKIVKEEEKIEQTVQKQELDIIGDSDFPEEVENLPTEQEILTHLYEISEETGKEIKVYSEEAFEEIEKEFGRASAMLVREGYNVSSEMTAEQRNTMKIIQVSYMLDNGLLGEGVDYGDLNTYVWYEKSPTLLPIGVPKPKYHIRKYLQGNIEVTDYDYGVGIEEDKMTYTLFDVNKEYVENGYDVPSKVELDDVIVKGGMVTKMDSPERRGAMIYIVLQPKHTMESEEFMEMYDRLEVEYGGKEVKNKMSTSDFLGDISNMYSTQIIDVLYTFDDQEDGYTGEEPVELKVNGEEIPLEIKGKEFTSKVK